MNEKRSLLTPSMAEMDRAYREEELREVRELAWSEGYAAAQYDIGCGADTPNPYRATPVEKRKNKARHKSAH